MASLSCMIRHLWQCASMLCTLILDATHCLRLCLRSPAAIAAENLFLRKQLALYQERDIKPQRGSLTTRFTLVWLSQWFDWQSALAVVQPETFKRWRRQGCQLFWRGTSCPGRPPIPVELQGLIRQMARDNLTWGQRRIANELRLKLGLRVSPRTVRKYMPTHYDRAPGHRVPSQRWRTFVRNHARALIVRGMAANLLTRGVQAVSARIRQSVHHWQHRFVASGMPRTTRSDAVSISLLSDTVSVPAAWSADTVDGVRVADRSPPAIELSCIPKPCTAARAIQVDIIVVHPTVATLCGWSRASPHVRSPRPLSHGGIRATPGRRAA